MFLRYPPFSRRFVRHPSAVRVTEGFRYYLLKYIPVLVVNNGLDFQKPSGKGDTKLFAGMLGEIKSPC